MPEDGIKTECLGGEFMIQDRDHLGESGQAGGAARHVVCRQPEQTQNDSRQRNSDQKPGTGQQGGERGYRRREFL